MPWMWNGRQDDIHKNIGWTLMYSVNPALKNTFIESQPVNGSKILP